MTFAVLIFMFSNENYVKIILKLFDFMYVIEIGVVLGSVCYLRCASNIQYIAGCDL